MSSRSLCCVVDRPAAPLRSVTVAAGLTLLILGVACGETTEPPGDDDRFADYEERTDLYADLDAAEAATQVLIDALCDATWECYDQSPALAEQSKQSFGRFGSVDECRRQAHRIAGADQLQKLFEPALQAGRMQLDVSAAEDCRRAYRSRLCESDPETVARRLPEECHQLFGGQLDEGDPCVVGPECGPSLSCNDDVDTDGCHGECTPPDQIDRCNGAICDDDQFCKYQLGEETYRCADRLQEDDHCGGHHECQPGLACVHGRCTPFDVGSDGDDCEAGDHGSHCRPGLVCSPHSETQTRTDATCSPIGTAGDRCYAQTDSDTTGCAHDHWCSTHDDSRFGQCTSRSPEGTSCQRHHHCETGYCQSDGDQLVCGQPDDEPCVHPDDE